MLSSQELQFSQGNTGWPPKHSSLQTEEDLERNPFQEEEVSKTLHVNSLTLPQYSVTHSVNIEYLTLICIVYIIVLYSNV